jgi:hypothetical protein
MSSTREEFWCNVGALALLQLRADSMSETLPMDRLWADRQQRATGKRPDRLAASARPSLNNRSDKPCRAPACNREMLRPGPTAVADPRQDLLRPYCDGRDALSIA